MSAKVAPPIASVQVKGKYNRAKALMGQGYGYRNQHNLRLPILLKVPQWISACFALKDREPLGVPLDKASIRITQAF